jgi:ABC-2 type transport system ATP-binding protein
MNDLGSICSLTERGSLLIKLESPEQKQAMMKQLVEKYDVDEVKVYEPSLNDIFVEYAGNAI